MTPIYWIFDVAFAVCIGGMAAHFFMFARNDSAKTRLAWAKACIVSAGCLAGVALAMVIMKWYEFSAFPIYLTIARALFCWLFFFCAFKVRDYSDLLNNSGMHQMVEEKDGVELTNQIN